MAVGRDPADTELGDVRTVHFFFKRHLEVIWKLPVLGGGTPDVLNKARTLQGEA